MRIEGDEIGGIPWDETRQPARTWFYPSPETDYGKWQRPGQLVRTTNGELLLNYTVSSSGKITPLELRSNDKGHTWSKPQPIAGLSPGEWEGQGIMHVFPDGKLRMLRQGAGGYSLAETPDDGRTWAMGSMIEVERDLVLYVYWDSFESLMRGQLIRVTPTGIAPIVP